MSIHTTSAFWDELEKIALGVGIAVPQVARRMPPVKPPPSAVKDIKVPSLPASSISPKSVPTPPKIAG